MKELKRLLRELTNSLGKCKIVKEKKTVEIIKYVLCEGEDDE